MKNKIVVILSLFLIKVTRRIEDKKMIKKTKEEKNFH